MSRWTFTRGQDLAVGDAIAFGGMRALVTNIRHNPGSSRYVLDIATASYGATYLVLDDSTEEPNGVYVDGLDQRKYPVQLEGSVLYSGALVYWVTRAGLVAARMRDVDMEARTVSLEVTATGNPTYPRGYVEHGVTFNSVVDRSTVYVRSGQYRIARPARISARWVDYVDVRADLKREERAAQA